MVVLLGLAFEEAIRIVADALQVKVKGQASDRQAALRKWLEAQPKNEQREQALCAVNVADTIRSARNDAAHYAASELDLYDAEGLLRDGLRAFPKLARLTPRAAGS